MNWVKARAGERSTWVGLAAIAGGIATLLGKPEITDGINEYLPLILAVIGGGLIAKPTPEPDLLSPLNRRR